MLAWPRSIALSTKAAAGRAAQPAPRRQPGAITGKSIGRVLAILRRESRGWNAPVLTLMAAEKHDPFLTLIGCILSLRTKDKMTAVAAPRLFAKARTPEEMLAMEPQEIEKLIYPVGFYRTKARVIREICRDLMERFGGRVPDKIDDLLTLKGVGRKTANLVVTESFRKPGHLRRHARASDFQSMGTGRYQDRRQDRDRSARGSAAPLLDRVQQPASRLRADLCQPISPWCSRCPMEKMCPRIGVVRSR